MIRLRLALLLLLCPMLSFAQAVNGIPNQTVIGNSAFITGAGSANVMTGCPVPAITAQAVTPGLVIHVRPNTANTTTTPTFNLCSLGAITIVKGSSGSLVALVANDYVTGVDAILYYTGSFWQLQNPQTSAAVVTSVAGTSPISSSGGVTPNVSCSTCTVTVVSGTSSLGTSAITSGSCATVVTTTATGTATTDVVPWGFSTDPTSTVGYSPTVNGMLTIIAYPTVNNVNFKVCNNTTASITPGAVTLNWRIVR